MADLAREVVLGIQTIGPMTDAAVQAVILDRVGPKLSAGQLRQVVGLSGGNPLYAIELAHAMAVRGDVDKELPRTLDALVGHRLRTLPEQTRRALAAASALRQPRIEHLRGLGLDEALPPAEAADLVTVAQGEIVFQHPLYAAAAYDALSGSQRLALHAQLARIVEGPEECARHQALGADRPDPRVADALDRAVGHALDRGAIGAAVDAAQLAIRMTGTDDDTVHERRVRLGTLLFRIGDAEGAAGQLSVVAESNADADVRANALLALAVVESERVSRSAGCAAASLALTLASDSDLVADLHLTLADVEWNKDSARQHADAAIAIIGRSDPARLGRARALRAEAAFVAGDGVDDAAFENLILAERASISGRPAWFMSVYLGVLARADRFDDATRVFNAIADFPDEGYDEAAICNALGWMVLVDFAHAEFDVASMHGTLMLDRASRAGLADHAMAARSHLARTFATTGDRPRCDEVLGELHEQVQTTDQKGQLAAMSGYVSFLRGDLETAVTDLTSSVEWARSMGWRDPGCVPEAEYLVETLLGTGRLDLADSELSGWELNPDSAQRPAVAGWTSRCRALIHAATGDTDAALACAQIAVDTYSSVPRPYDRARALLTLGQTQRRAKQKASARRTLIEAHGEFQRLGATPYAERAQQEMARIGGRAPAPTTLTETERRVAELAATGKTRADIAVVLFLSPHTVAANLTRIYRKLGAANRAELVARLRELDM